MSYLAGKGILSIGTAMGVMLVFIPLTIAGTSLDASPVFIFASASLACVALIELLSNLVEIPFQANCRSVRRSRHPVDLATL